MITPQEYAQARERAIGFFARTGIVLTEKEKQDIEVADFGLGDLGRIGLEVLVYVNTSRVCAKELVLFPGQTCPEHRHPTRGGVPGKEETFRQIELKAGDQYTLAPDTLHWFRAGGEGAVVSEFSSTSTDEQDQFSDPRIGRFTRIGE